MIAVGEAELLFSCLKTLLMYKVSINQSVKMGRGAGKGAEGTVGGPAHWAGKLGPHLLLQTPWCRQTFSAPLGNPLVFHK